MDAHKPNEKYQDLIRSMNGLTREDHQSHYWQNTKNRPLTIPKLRMRNVARAMKDLQSDIQKSNELHPNEKTAFTAKASDGLRILNLTIERHHDLLPKAADSELIGESVAIFRNLAKMLMRD